MKAEEIKVKFEKAKPGMKVARIYSVNGKIIVQAFDKIMTFNPFIPLIGGYYDFTSAKPFECNPKTLGKAFDNAKPIYADSALVMPFA